MILDSFSDSLTTAHAVLEANKLDDGNCRFTLVEMEDYADRLTAERVRRVINGYDFTETRKTELMWKRLNWPKLRNADQLTDQVEKLKNLRGYDYDRIEKTVKSGEKIVAERVEGLGGTFTYCTLGSLVELDKVLNGEILLSYAGIGMVLFHMATNSAFDPTVVHETGFYLGRTEDQYVWLIYRSDLEWLKALNAAPLRL